MESNNIFLALLFKKTLNNLLSDNEGMIVSIDNELKPLFPGQEKVLVFKKENIIDVMNYDGDLENGEFISIDFTDDTNIENND